MDRGKLSHLMTQFEAGTLPRPEWTHVAHLEVAGVMVLTYSWTEALDRLRQGIRHYNECQGIANTDRSGYHETLTIFWASIARAFLRRETAGMSVHDAVARLVAAYGHRRALHCEYYRDDVVGSEEARRRWVPPDIQTLP